MHPRSTMIVAAVRGCIGTRFRAQGRTPGLGLDCVGVALVALRAAGAEARVPAYSVGGDHEPVVAAALAAAGCVAVEAAAAGDLLLVAPAPGRRHLTVATGAGLLVHAHAGLGRVVEGPADPAWDRLGAWRLPVEG